LPESRWAQAGVTRTAADAPRKSATFRETVQNIIQPAARVVADPLRPVSLLIWIYAFAMLAFNALPPVFSLYLNDRFGINTEQIGYFFMVFGAIGVLMRIGPVGWFNEWLGEVRTMQVGLFLLLAGFILVPLAPSLPLFIAAQVLLPLGTALLFPANSALVSHRAHHDEIGVTLGVQQTYRGVAAILGPIYAGSSYQLLGQHVPFYISAVITVFVIYLTLRIQEDTPTPVAAST
jgi:MFS family permease